MRRIQEQLKKYARVLNWIFIFLTASVLLYFILPGEPKFRFEYQKGFAWPHETLVAPFDFAILKSENVLNQEIEQQAATVIPYFAFDTVVVTEKIRKLENDLNLLPGLGASEKKMVTEELVTHLKSLYMNGILLRSPEMYPELQQQTEIWKRTGNNLIRINISNLYSEKSAYSAFNEKLHSLASRFPGLKRQSGSIPAESYISANLHFDEQTTALEKEDLKQNISPTRGMIRAGERIIIQGEMVDNEKFQILESLKNHYEKARPTGINQWVVSTGKITLILVFLGLVFTFLYFYRRDTLFKFSKLFFLIMFMVSMVFISLLIGTIPNLSIYLVPLAIFPIVVRTFFDSRTATFMLIITALMIGFYAPNSYEFVLIQVTAGIVAVFSLNRMHRRVHLVIASIWVFLTYMLVYSALNVIHEGTFSTFDYSTMKWFLWSSIFILLVYPLIFIFEKLFGFISDVTLIELSDTNQPLLRKLAEEAPGTFQHSIQIANLSEEVILRIGGNPFLVRAGALYHDIGKIAKPNFFIENQAMGMNPHDNLNYIKSAEVIIDHVKNGVKLAKKHQLPDLLVEFIATHHGTTKAKYFYLKHQQENPDEKIDERTFAYPGPLPVSKEASVVMLVDGIEAASRSLKDKTSGNIHELVNKMIDQKINDRQLDQSNLTFSDIKIIKETLIKKLINMYHVRIEYPKETQEENPRDYNLKDKDLADSDTVL